MARLVVVTISLGSLILEEIHGTEDGAGGFSSKMAVLDESVNFTLHSTECLQQTIVIIEHIQILHGQNPRTPTFLVLGPCNDIMIPSFNNASAPPTSECADIPGIAYHRGVLFICVSVFRRGNDCSDSEECKAVKDMLGCSEGDRGPISEMKSG